VIYNRTNLLKGTAKVEAKKRTRQKKEKDFILSVSGWQFSASRLHFSDDALI